MKKKPIYLYITPYFPSESRWQGGYCYDAVRAIIHDGRYDVKVVVTGVGQCDYNYNGLHVNCIKRAKLPFDCAPFLFTRINGWLLKRKLVLMGVALSDIAVCHSNVEIDYSSYIKKLNPNIRAIWQSHSSWMGAPFSLYTYRIGVIKGLSDLLYLYWRKMLESMDVVVVLSKLHVKQFGKAYPNGPLGLEIDIRDQTLIRHYRLIKPKRISILYNGIDAKVFNPIGRCSHNDFIIGCVANFGATKGQITLIKAFATIVKTIPNAKLIFVGSGQKLDECKKVTVDLGLNEKIVFKKECDHLKLADIYRSFDLFVLPSWQEGFCCVLVEAAGCGTPSMATDAISFREVIPEEDWNKWLIKPKDHIALAEKIVDYHAKRYKFRFNRSMDINDLWREFLDEI